MLLPYKDTTKLRISNPYGIEDTKYEAGYHTGLDIVSEGNKIIVAIGEGQVIRSQNYGSWGNYIVVHQNDGLYCVYAHLSERYVVVGEEIVAGQEIGKEGASGNTTGSHLHIELQQRYYDPHSSKNVADYLGVVNEFGEVRLKVEIIKELEIIKEGLSYWGCLIKKGDEYKALVELRPFAESNGQEITALIEQNQVLVSPGAYQKLRDIKRIVQDIR